MTPLEPVFTAPGKRGHKHAPDLRGVVDAMYTGCQWRYLPEPSGPWTRGWSQFRRWSRTERGASTHPAVREAVEVTGLPRCALACRRHPHESRVSELMLEHLLTQQGSGVA